MKIKPSPEHKNLIRRYLLWAYKSTRESFERIERKSTQLTVDEYIFGHLSRNKCDIPDEFKAYIAKKRQDELELKYVDAKRKAYQPQYVYLKDRLKAIEAAIKHFLGGKKLKRIQGLYEQEFTRRILAAVDH